MARATSIKAKIEGIVLGKGSTPNSKDATKPYPFMKIRHGEGINEESSVVEYRSSQIVPADGEKVVMHVACESSQYGLRVNMVDFVSVKK
jgi:hypothetical protein